MATLKSFIPSIVFHPGITLSEKLVESGMSIKEFALRTSIPQKAILALINGKSSMTPAMAEAFEKVTRIPARFWMEKQRVYDEHVARTKKEGELASATNNSLRL